MTIKFVAETGSSIPEDIHRRMGRLDKLLVAACLADYAADMDIDKLVEELFDLCLEIDEMPAGTENGAKQPNLRKDEGREVCSAHPRCSGG